MNKFILLGLILCFTIIPILLLAQNNPIMTSPTLEKTTTLLPDQSWYFLKTIKEGLQRLTSWTASERLSLYLQLAETRLGEYQALKKENKEALAQESLKKHQRLVAEIKKILDNPKNEDSLDVLANQVISTTQKQFQTLQQLKNNASPNIRNEIDLQLQNQQNILDRTKIILEKSAATPVPKPGGIKDFFSKLFFKLWPITKNESK